MHFVDKQNVDFGDNRERSSSLINRMKNKGRPKPSCLENMTPFVLLIGLGAHAIFEGIAMGSETEAKNAAIFALAIFLHKGAAAMSLGISLTKTFPDRDGFVLKLIAFFASFTPVGIAIGISV